MAAGTFGLGRRCYSSPPQSVLCTVKFIAKSKGIGFPYSLPSVGLGADPGVQAVSQQVSISYLPDGRLPLISARSAVTCITAPWPVSRYTAW